MVTSLVGGQGVGLAGDQDEERVDHGNDGRLREEGPVARGHRADAAKPCNTTAHGWHNPIALARHKKKGIDTQHVKLSYPDKQFILTNMYKVLE